VSGSTFSDSECQAGSFFYLRFGDMNLGLSGPRNDFTIPSRVVVVLWRTYITCFLRQLFAPGETIALTSEFEKSKRAAVGRRID